MLFTHVVLNVAYFHFKCQFKVVFALTYVLNMLSFGYRYIFFADKVEIQDISKQTCFFVLVGPRSNQVYKMKCLYISSFLFLFYQIDSKELLVQTDNGRIKSRRPCWTTIWFTQALQCNVLFPFQNYLLEECCRANLLSIVLTTSLLDTCFYTTYKCIYILTAPSLYIRHWSMCINLLPDMFFKVGWFFLLLFSAP